MIGIEFLYYNDIFIRQMQGSTMVSLLRNLKLSQKLVITSLLIGLIPALLILYVTINAASESLEKQSFNQLISVKSNKKSQIERYFSEREGDLHVLLNIVETLQYNSFQSLSSVQELKKTLLNNYISQLKANLLKLSTSPYNIQALKEFSSAFSQGNTIKSIAWNKYKNNYQEYFQQINQTNGWYDLFLINTDGDIVYSNTQKSDLGLNLTQLPLKTSTFGQAFQQAAATQSGDIIFGDLAPYAPSNNAPAAFMVKKVISEAGVVLGYMALQIPMSSIQKITSQRAGMGETGESFLVGQDHLMRTNSFLSPKEYSVKNSFKNKLTIDTTAVKKALDGEIGQEVMVDYKGHPVLSAWDIIDLGNGIQWVLISEIAIAEVFAPHVKGESLDFYNKYIKEYGYHDLFLMNPDGYVFIAQLKDQTFIRIC